MDKDGEFGYTGVATKIPVSDLLDITLGVRESFGWDYGSVSSVSLECPQGLPGPRGPLGPLGKNGTTFFVSISRTVP